MDLSKPLIETPKTKNGVHEIVFPVQFSSAMPIQEALYGRLLHTILNKVVQEPERFLKFKTEWLIGDAPEYPYRDPIKLFREISIPFVGEISEDREHVEPPFFVYDRWSSDVSYNLKYGRKGIVTYLWGDAPNALSKGRKGGEYDVPDGLHPLLREEVRALDKKLAGHGDLYDGPWTHGTFNRTRSRINELREEKELGDILRDEEIQSVLFDLARFHILDTFFRGHEAICSLEKYKSDDKICNHIFWRCEDKKGKKNPPSYFFGCSLLKAGVALCEEYLSETEPRTVPHPKL